MKNFKERSWSRLGNFFSLPIINYYFTHPNRDQQFNYCRCRRKRKKNGIDFIYSISEVEHMLNKTGFHLNEIYSIPGKKTFTVGEPRALYCCRKNMTIEQIFTKPCLIAYIANPRDF
jgi:hypothetical protein